MSSLFTPDALAPTVTFGQVDVDGLSIAYREAGDASNPKLVLLHGWPSSSHQYRNLIPALADRFHVIAPDYPGFGDSSTPDPASFPYTFDKLAEVTERFLKIKGFDRFGLYVQDYGGPVGFRIITKNPSALEWLVIQNTNAYEIGFTEAWAGLRNALWLDRSTANEEGAAGLLALDIVKATYLTGSTQPGPHQSRQLEHGLLPHPPAHPRTQAATRPLLRLPHQRQPLPGVAAFPEAASAEDPHLLGSR